MSSDREIIDAESTSSSTTAMLQAYLQEPAHWLDEDQNNTNDYFRDHDYHHLFHMLEMNPVLASQRFSDSGFVVSFPISFLLAAKAPLEMIQSVYQMYRDAIVSPDKGGFSLLHDAALYHCSYDVLSFLAQENPSAISQTTAPEDAAGELPIELLLECLSYANFKEDDFVKSFQLLYNGYPPVGFWAHFMDWVDALTKLLAHSKTPPSLLTWLAKNQKSTVRCKMGFQNHVELRTFVNNLKHFVPFLGCKRLLFLSKQGTHEGDFIGMLFSEVPIPSTLAVTFMGLHFSLSTNFDKLCESWGSSQIEEISINDVSDAGDERDGLNVLLRKFVALPNLKKLIFTKNEATGVLRTEAVIDLLEGGMSLDLLLLSGDFGINAEDLSNELQKSKSTSFVAFTDSSSSEYNAAISYHSSMNQHGRAKVSALNATESDLVECLSSVQKHHKLTSKLKFAVLYGILHEAPGVWANKA